MLRGTSKDPVRVSTDQNRSGSTALAHTRALACLASSTNVPGAFPGFVKQGVLAMQDGFFQCPLDQVIVQWGAGLPKKQGEFFPVFEQVGDRLAQSGVRFHFPFRELGRAPAMQFFHHRAAMLLVEAEALFRR